MILRLKFEKHGAVRYIGHLDIMRYFQKCIKRAGVDIAYSAGFSPHQIMSFAQPLGVGLESNGEYMDIEVNSYESLDSIVRDMNAVSVPGIKVTSCVELSDNAPNAMSSVKAASYSVKLIKDMDLAGKDITDNNVNDKIKEFMGAPEILFEKKSKKGLREVDIKPGIYDFNYDGKGFHIFCDSSSAGNIKPQYVLNAFFKHYGVEIPEHPYFVTREDTFTDVGTEDEHKFIPLSEAGKYYE